MLVVHRSYDGISPFKVCLLLLRGDMSKGEARETAQEFIPEGKTTSVHAKSILSMVQVTSSLNPFAGKAEAAASNLNPFFKD